MLRNKRIISIILMLIIVSVLTMACSKESAPSGSDNPEVSNENNEGVSEKKKEHKTSKENKVVYEYGNFDENLEDPIIITSIGQSADVSMLDALMKKIDREYTFDPLAKADDMVNSKTIFIAAGASSKGLGAAGISVEDETKRAQEILDMLKADESIKVVLVHLGGQARRGTLSDQFTNIILEVSDYIIVVEDGDSDGFFTNYASNNSIPISYVLNISDAIEPLKLLLED